MWLSLFDVILLAAVTLKLVVVFVLLHHLATEPKKTEVAVAYASQVRREVLSMDSHHPSKRGDDRASSRHGNTTTAK